MISESKVSELEESFSRLVITMEPGRAGFDLLSPEASLRLHSWVVIINPLEPVEADFWIVFGNARPVDRIYVAPENTLLVVLEPEEKKVYPKQFYRQFYHLVDTHLQSQHPRCNLHAPCFDWHVGIDHSKKAYRYGYSHLKALKAPKTPINKVSVVCSDARKTKGQVQRLEFLELLKSRLGDQLVHFGRGFNPVEDKLDAIYGFRLNLVLENCSAPHYWTEKLSDAYLGWSFPIYSGCPNISDYFPEDAMIHLKSLDAGSAAKKILSILNRPQYESERKAVALGRESILETYNPVVSWVRWAQSCYDPEAPKKWLTLRSHKAFRPFPMNWLFKLKSNESYCESRSSINP